MDLSDNLYTAEEFLDIMNMEVIFDEVIIDEDLVTDLISIAGYTEDEAYAAAEAVAMYDDLN